MKYLVLSALLGFVTTAQAADDACLTKMHDAANKKAQSDYAGTGIFVEMPFLVSSDASGSLYEVSVHQFDNGQEGCGMGVYQIKIDAQCNIISGPVAE